ncbi:CD63 antigen-like [Amphiura filiformis]|uniref:CD63 antigen-like n=1 Tax=Amphiura filiformis TaxID=82378 RepID=UPI003B227FBA
MAEGSAQCVKYLLFFFNFIFFLCGLGIIIGGALVFTIYNDYVDFTGDSGNVVPIILIIVGSFIFVTGFLGCCGAIKENYTMMAMFAGIMVVLLLVEVGVGIAGYVLRDELSDTIEENMFKLMPEYISANATKNLFDNMHEDLKCCGTHNYTDWFATGSYVDAVCPDTASCVPESCCKDKTSCNYMIVPSNPTDIYTKGCNEKLSDLITDNIAIIAAIAIVIAVIEVFGIVCACCLIKSIKSGYEVV